MKNAIMTILTSISMIIVLLALSWALCNGLIWLIMFCFDLEYTVKIGTGVWLILFMLKLTFYNGGKK